MAITPGNFSPGYQAAISVNGVDIAAYCQSVTPSVTRKEDELPRLGGNQIAMLVGPPKTTLKLKGWSDPVVCNLLFGLAIAATATKVPISYCQQPTVGGVTHTGTGYVASYEEPADATNPGDWTSSIVVDGDWA